MAVVTNKEAKTRLKEIAGELRILAPSLRGAGMCASDASFNRVNRYAAAIEAIAEDRKPEEKL